MLRHGSATDVRSCFQPIDLLIYFQVFVNARSSGNERRLP